MIMENDIGVVKILPVSAALFRFTHVLVFADRSVPRDCHMRRPRGWQSLPPRRTFSQAIVVTALVRGSCILWLPLRNIVSARSTYLPQRPSLAFADSLFRLRSALDGSTRQNRVEKTGESSPLPGYRSTFLTGAKQKVCSRSSSLSTPCGAFDSQSSRRNMQHSSRDNTPRIGAKMEDTRASMPEAVTRSRRTGRSKQTAVVSGDQNTTDNPSVCGLVPAVGASPSYGSSVTRGQLLSTVGVLGLAAGVVLAGGGGGVKAVNAVEVSREGRTTGCAWALWSRVGYSLGLLCGCLGSEQVQSGQGFSSVTGLQQRYGLVVLG